MIKQKRIGYSIYNKALSVVNFNFKLNKYSYVPVNYDGFIIRTEPYDSAILVL